MTVSRPPTGAAPFLVDHMLIKLGKYLRILGHDAVWIPGERSLDLVARANREGRVFLTRNARLRHQEPRAARSVLISSDDPVIQLREVVHALHLQPEALLFTRCIRCNLPLEKVSDKAAIEDRVHPNVYECYRSFYRCPDCGTVFWKGSHVRNTCRKLGISWEGETGEGPIR